MEGQVAIKVGTDFMMLIGAVLLIIYTTIFSLAWGYSDFYLNSQFYFNLLWTDGVGMAMSLIGLALSSMLVLKKFLEPGTMAVQDESSLKRSDRSRGGHTK